MNRSLRNQLNVVLALFVLCACSVKLTPDQQKLWAVRIYNDQFDLYVEQILKPGLDPALVEELKKTSTAITPEHMNPDLTAEQISLLVQKKEVLKDIKPYIRIIEAGDPLSTDSQKDLIELIDTLINLVD